jgi:SOS-response transcriptional repressor LexA
MQSLARRPVKFGFIQQCDDSLIAIGIHEGDLIVVDLKASPAQNELCAAFTACGELVIRFYHEEVNGDIKLTQTPNDSIVQVFAPNAVIIFGRIRKVIHPMSSCQARR